jgi:hypothetical protein
MMEIYMIKTEQGLKPLYPSDLEAFNKLKGEYKVTVTNPRNYRFHKKYFALLNLAFANQDQFDEFTAFRYIIQMKAGYYTPVKTDKGVAYLPDSISFAKMSEEDFSELYNKVLDIICELLDVSDSEIEKELLAFM